MPKRYGNIYDKIIDIDNIKRAHQFARKDKSFYTAVIKTDENLDFRAHQIQYLLKTHKYKVSPYRTSVIQDKNKKRILYKLPYYPDRVIQWTIMLQMEEVFVKTFTDFTCASIANRGIHQASAMLDRYINVYPEETKYCLKLDIKKFYPSINRTILKQLLRKKIKDKDLLIELDKIIDSMENADISSLDISQEEKYYYTRPGKGLPVGSYLSQYLANFYLAFFDHWLKEELHCKYVIRYMDDLIILGSSKEELRIILNKIKEYLENNLDLEIKHNYQIFPTAIRGVDFVGYRHFVGYKLLRKTTLKTFKDCALTIQECQETKDFPTEKQWCAWVSSLGWLQWCDADNFYNKYYIKYSPIINAYYNVMKKGKNKTVFNSFIIPFTGLKEKKKYYTNDINHKIIHIRSVRNDVFESLGNAG